MSAVSQTLSQSLALNPDPEIFDHIKKGNLEKVQQYIKSKGNLHITNAEGLALFVFAAMHGQNKIIDLLLSAKPVGMKKFEYLKSNVLSLIVAALKGHTEVVDNLLKNGAPLNASDEKGYTALMASATEGHVEVFKLLLKFGAKLTRKGVKNDGALLCCVAKGGKPDLLKLLEGKSDVNLVDESGLTPIFYAIQEGHYDMVVALVEAKAKLEFATLDGHTLLMYAAEYKRLSILEFLINAARKQGLDFINQQDNAGFSVLLRASLKGNEEVVQYLIRVDGINIYATSKEGLTALHCSFQNNHLTIVNILIEAIAHRGFQLDTRDQFLRALQLIAIKGHTAGVKRLLETIEKVGDPSWLENAVTVVLGESIINNHSEIFKYIIAQEAYIKFVLKNSEFILLASYHGREAMVIALLDKRVPVNTLLSSENVCFSGRGLLGATPLMFAAQQGHLDIVQVLLAAKADLNLQRQNGVTALMLAAVRGEHNIAKLLIDQKADLEVREQNGFTAFTSVCQIPESMASRGNHIEVLKLLFETAIARANGNQELIDNITDEVAKSAIRKGDGEFFNFLLANETYGKVIHKYANQLLFEAAYYGQALILNALVEQTRIPVDSAPNFERFNVKIEGLTPLMLAAQEERTEVVQTLIALKANIKARRFGGVTALMMAAEAGAFDTLKLLVTDEEDLDSLSELGDTALTLADKNRQEAVVRFLLKSKMVYASQKIVAQEHYKTEEMNKYRALILLFCDEVCDLQPRFDAKTGIQIHFKIFKEDRHIPSEVRNGKESHTIPFEVLLNVVQKIYKAQNKNKDFNLKGLGHLLWESLKEYNVKADALKQEQDNKYQQEVESLCQGLDYESITQGLALQIGHKIKPYLTEIQAVKVDIDNTLLESHFFLNSSRARYIPEIGPKKAILQENNDTLSKEVFLLIQKVSNLELEIAWQKETYINRALGLSLEFYQKIQVQNLEEARKLKENLHNDGSLTNTLGDIKALAVELKIIYDTIIKLKDTLQKQRANEQNALKKYLDFSAKEQAIEDQLRDREKEELQLKQLKEQAELKRQMEQEKRREEIKNRKERARQHWAEAQAELKRQKEERSKPKDIKENDEYRNRYRYRPIHPPAFTLDLKSGASLLVSFREELIVLETLLNQLMTVSKPKSDSTLKTEAYGLLGMCARLMEILKDLPENKTGISPDDAEHFRDVVYHAKILPPFDIKTIIEMTQCLARFVRSIEKEDAEQIKILKEQLGIGKKQGNTLFSSLCTHPIEDETVKRSLLDYQDQIQQEDKHIQFFKKELAAERLLRGHAEGVAIARKGACCARIKQFYRKEGYLPKPKRAIYDKAIELGKHCRHRRIDLQGYQALDLEYELQLKIANSENDLQSKNHGTELLQLYQSSREGLSTIPNSKGVRGVQKTESKVKVRT